MSIKKNRARPNNPWEVRWREGGRQFSRSFPTRASAEAFDAKRREDMRTGRYLSPTRSNATFGEVAERWLATRRHRHTTHLRNKGILELHLLPVFGRVSLRDISRSMIIREVARWECAGLKRRTIDRHLAVLTAIFNMALADDLLIKSPIAQIDRPTMTPPHRRALDVREQGALLRAAPEHYEPFLYVALSTGCRISELFALRIGDVDLENRTLVIHHSKTETGKRVLTISETDAIKILRHITTTGRTPQMKDAPLFVTPSGDGLNYSNFRRRVFIPTCKRARLEGLQVHDLRRTCATMLIKSGMPHKEVQARLGHRDIRTTMNMYAESTKEGRLLVATVMESVLEDALSESNQSPP
ncbi:MAG: site-specific integrase [Actinobacteria bacterium]|nr:site-specific integrase [Actinomycetota bacterium]